MDKNLEVNRVVVAFDKYSETSDKSLIKAFSLDELLKTKALRVGQRNSSWYYLLESRINELKAIKNSKASRKFQFNLSILNVLLGVVGTLLALYIWSLFNNQ